MNIQSRRLRIAALISLALLSSYGRLSAQTYHASILSSPDAFQAAAWGISSFNIVGYQLGNNNSEATLWNTTTGSLTSLNPGTDFSSIAYGASSDTQVGISYNPVALDGHAALWHGTAGSYVDLNPAGFYTSQAYAVSGSSEVGGGGLSTGPQGHGHALLWQGTAASAVDLNPAGYIGSVAADVDGNNIVGSASPLDGSAQRAGLWQGAAHTFINLQPAGFVGSSATGIWQNTEVGTGYVSSDFSGPTHALLWHGTAASVVDLNPGAGFSQSTAYDVFGNLEVGFGSGTATGGYDHALLWQGTAASVVDLQSLLTGLGPQFVSSDAYGVNDAGLIVGSATDINGRNYAVTWAPTPEPSSAILVALGLTFVLGMRPARFHRCS